MRIFIFFIDLKIWLTEHIYKALASSGLLVTIGTVIPLAHLRMLPIISDVLAAFAHVTAGTLATITIFGVAQKTFKKYRDKKRRKQNG